MRDTLSIVNREVFVGVNVSAVFDKAVKVNDLFPLLSLPLKVIVFRVTHQADIVKLPAVKLESVNSRVYTSPTTN